MNAQAVTGEGTAMSGANPVVETRLRFDNYDSASGHLEARGLDGTTAFTADLRAVLTALPCFTAQSQITTGTGMVAVSDLRPGMRVITRDNGMQELRWIGRRRFGWRDLGLNPLLRPVRIAAGALGEGLPERDMVVSPNHHFLTRQTGLGPGGERLSMARDMVGRPGIDIDTATAVDYWQLLFTRHELVLSDGCWSESFRPTEASLAALGDESRSDLVLALPGLEADVLSGFDSVRPFAGVDSAA